MNERSDPKKILDETPPAELADRMLQQIPTPYPAENVIQAVMLVLVEGIARKYPSLTQQIQFSRKLFEHCEYCLKRRAFVAQRVREIAEQLQKEGKPSDRDQVLGVLMREMQEAADEPVPMAAPTSHTTQ